MLYNKGFHQVGTRPQHALALNEDSWISLQLGTTNSYQLSATLFEGYTRGGNPKDM